MRRTELKIGDWSEQYKIAEGWRIDEPGAVLVLSGQGPSSPTGEIVGRGDFEAQVRQTFDNLRALLEQGDASLSDVVKLTTYLTDMSNIATFGRIRQEYFTAPYPAATAVGVTALAGADVMVEVDATVVLPA